ncbi:MAG: hypothetical protein ACYC4R_09125 [Anaerolineae bacterium]
MNPFVHTSSGKRRILPAAPTAVCLTALLLGMLVFGTAGPSVSAQPVRHTYLPVIQTTCNDFEQALLNPSFEEGIPSWSIGGYARLSRTTSSDGYYSMLFGTLTDSADVISQTVTVPGWTKAATLFVDWEMWSYETALLPYDVLYVVLYDETDDVQVALETVSNLEIEGVWTQMVVPIANAESYRNHEWSLSVYALTDDLVATWWYIDNVRLYFSCTGIEVDSASSASLQSAGMSLAEAEADLAPTSATPIPLTPAAREMADSLRAQFPPAERE